MSRQRALISRSQALRAAAVPQKGRAAKGGPSAISAGRASATATLARPRAARARSAGPLVLMLVGKLVGLVVLFAACSLLYDLVSSNDFTVSRISVAGNHLLTTEEVETTSAASGRNLFWVRQAEVAQRLRLLPPIQNASVRLELPDHLLIRIEEREPVAIWLSNETPFLVDQTGLVLAARPADRPLMTVVDASGQTIGPGSRVSADVVGNVGQLDAVLNATFGQQQRRYEYTAETGMNVLQSVGPRLIIGSGSDLDWKMAAIKAIVGHLEATRTSAELIDVRFRDRPYYR